MRINPQMLDVALAKSCMNMNDLRSQGVSSVTFNKIRNDADYIPKTKTIGKIAKALCVPVKELIEKER